MRYEAKVRSTSSNAVFSVIVEATHRMYAIEQVNSTYGKENVVIPAYEVPDNYRR